jgi:hypothetical protein
LSPKPKSNNKQNCAFEYKALIIIGIFNWYEVFYIIGEDLKRSSKLLLIL